MTRSGQEGSLLSVPPGGGTKTFRPATSRGQLTPPAPTEVAPTRRVWIHESLEGDVLRLHEKHLR